MFKTIYYALKYVYYKNFGNQVIKDAIEIAVHYRECAVCQENENYCGSLKSESSSESYSSISKSDSLEPILVL